MFLSKRPNGVYYIFYNIPNGKRSSVSTNTKLKSEANKFLIKFASMTSSEDGVKISPISIENFSK